MLNHSLPLMGKSITTNIRTHFGVGKLILHYIRTVLNRIRWEENRELHSLQTRNANLPRTTEQANKLFVATEQDLSLSEQARMQRIDRVHFNKQRSSELALSFIRQSHIRKDWTLIISWISRSSSAAIAKSAGKLWIGSTLKSM